MGTLPKKSVRNTLDGPIQAPDPEAITAGVAQREAEAAFARSDSYTFAGQALKAFSIERQAAAQRLGLRYGNLGRGSVERIPFDLEQPGKKPVRSFYINYKGMLDDCILVLRLCLLEPEEIVRIRGEEQEAQFWLDAYRWAGENGIGIHGSRWGEAFVAFSQIVTDLQATAFKVDESQRPKGAKGNDAGN